jgi:hypothetical protein
MGDGGRQGIGPAGLMEPWPAVAVGAVESVGTKRYSPTSVR